MLELDVDVDVEVPVPVLVARVRRMPILLDGVGPKADTTMDVSVEAPSTSSASKERGCIFIMVDGAGRARKDMVGKLLGFNAPIKRGTRSLSLAEIFGGEMTSLASLGKHLMSL